jgi:hypothetical protein
VNPRPYSPVQELEALGYEVRIVNSHVSVVNSDGDEIAVLPLSVLDSAGEAGAPRPPERVADWQLILPADLLGRRD